MPRFYFHVRTSQGHEPDEVGIVFNTVDDAVADARRARGELLADAALDQHPPRPLAFEITDERGTIVATVPFIE